MPGPLYDCYVLAPRRSAELALRFLNHFMPERRALFDPIDPHDVLGVPVDSTEEEVFRCLESEPTRAYSMYWSNLGLKPPFNASVSFTEDECLILGLSAAQDDEEALAIRSLQQLKEFAASAVGYAGVEEPPAISRRAFVSRASGAP